MHRTRHDESRFARHAGFAALSWHFAVPVSYTHLSLIVMLVAAIIVPFGLEGLAVNAGLATRANLSELQVKAVSYTHHRQNSPARMETIFTISKPGTNIL